MKTIKVTLALQLLDRDCTCQRHPRPTDPVGHSITLCINRCTSISTASNSQGWPSSSRVSCPSSWTALPPGRIPPRSRPSTAYEPLPAPRLRQGHLSRSRDVLVLGPCWGHWPVVAWAGSWAGFLGRWIGGPVEGGRGCVSLRALAGPQNGIKRSRGSCGHEIVGALLTFSSVFAGLVPRYIAK